MTLRTWFAKCFSPLVPNDDFHCDVTYLAVKNASWQIWLRIEIDQLWHFYRLRQTKYELRKFGFTTSILPIWAVFVNTTNTFKTRLG